MARKVFSVEEQEELKKNPYTLRVTAKQISFTAEFKQEFWWLYCEKGLHPATIIEQLGYDPALLGGVRISGIQKHIKEEMECAGTFQSGRCARGKSYLSADDGYRVPESMTAMRHEIQYLRQEIEYLKKISSLRAMKK